MFPKRLVESYSRIFRGELRAYIDAFCKMLREQDEISISEAIDEFRRNYKPTAKFESQVRSVFSQIQSWTKWKQDEIISKKIATRTKQIRGVLVGTGSRQSQGDANTSELRFPVISIANGRTEEIRELVDATVTRNLNLNTQIRGEYFAKTQSIIFGGLREGKSWQSIVDEVVANEGGRVTESKAHFWARDQGRKFFAAVAELNQRGSGIPGYIWRCSHRKTRDSHLRLDNTYHTWEKRPRILYGSKTIEAHPGEDWECECWAEPSLGDEPDVKQWKDEWVASPVNTSIAEGVEELSISVPQGGASVIAAIRAVDNILDINPTTARQKFRFKRLSENDPVYSNFAAFYDTATGDIHVRDTDGLRAIIVHEIYHKLDWEYLSATSASGSFIPGSKLEDANKLIRSIQDTSTYAKFMQLHTMDQSRIRAWSASKSMNEWMARVFEQYIAFKTNDKQLSKQVRVRAAALRDFFGIDFYLTEKEVEKVFSLFDDYLKKKGLLR